MELLDIGTGLALLFKCDSFGRISNVEALKESGLRSDRRQALGGASWGAFGERIRYSRGVRDFRTASGKGAATAGEARTRNRAPRFERRLSTSPAPEGNFGARCNQRRGRASGDHIVRNESWELRSEFHLHGTRATAA